MKIYLLIVLIAWIDDSCFATIYTSKGVIEPYPYVGMKKVDRGAVHSRRKRSTDFTSSEAQAIVDKHNELRSSVSPEASDMSFMVWDDDLATLAQQWSEECIWDHGFPEPNLSKFSSYGQNMWIGTGSPDNPPDGIGATQSWYNEERMYTYETRECTGVCGHYYQVVWATSYAVGCGLSFCETTSDGDINAWIITCNYGPAGNYNRHPYLSGPSCTKCSSGAGQCYNNLCRSCEDHNEECICKQQCHNCGTLNTTSCRCDCQPGFMFDDCSAECGDTHSMCNAGWYRGQCSGYEYVREGCQLMCNLCSPVPEDFICDDSVEEDDTTIDPTSPSGDDIVEVVPTSPVEEDGQNQCAEKECNNGGTFDVDTCKCACPSGYQGNTCEENKEQVKNGVQVTIAASITVWDGIKSALLQSIADILDEFCNSPTNYGLCCPSSGNRIGNDTLNYVDTADIFIGNGFPKSINSTMFITLIYVRPKVNNTLCEAGASYTAKRQQRDIYPLIEHRMTRDIEFYLDQDILYDAISINSYDIAIAIGVNVVGVKRGEVINEEQELSVGRGMSDGTITKITIGLLLSFILPSL